MISSTLRNFTTLLLLVGFASSCGDLNHAQKDIVLANSTSTKELEKEVHTAINEKPDNVVKEELNAEVTELNRTLLNNDTLPIKRNLKVEENYNTLLPETKAKLLFSSGFEGVEVTENKYDYQYIIGKDIETGFTWPPAILGSSVKDKEPSGIHTVNDGGGPAIDNYIEKVIGPKGKETNTLLQRVNYDVQVTQTPYQINNIKENPKELYMTYWMKTDDFSVKGKDVWRAIWEYKTKNYASYKDGFRMIAFMATDIRGTPYWQFQGDIGPRQPIWRIENYDIPLILNEWFKVEYYLKWSNNEDGYASMKVNGQLIAEHQGPTTHKADPLDFIMITQVYGNNYPMYQWVDDIEIWDGLPNP